MDFLQTDVFASPAAVEETHAQLKEEYSKPDHWPKHVMVRYTWYVTGLDVLRLSETAVKLFLKRLTLFIWNPSGVLKLLRATPSDSD